MEFEARFFAQGEMHFRVPFFFDRQRPLRDKLRHLALDISRISGALALSWSQKDTSSNAAAARQGGGAEGGDTAGVGGGAGGAGMEKTNSWYWRRMSRAAARDGKEGAGVEGAGNEKVLVVPRDDSDVVVMGTDTSFQFVRKFVLLLVSL